MEPPGTEIEMKEFPNRERQEQEEEDDLGNIELTPNDQEEDLSWGDRDLSDIEFSEDEDDNEFFTPHENMDEFDWDTFVPFRDNQEEFERYGKVDYAIPSGFEHAEDLNDLLDAGNRAKSRILHKLFKQHFDPKYCDRMKQLYNRLTLRSTGGKVTEMLLDTAVVALCALFTKML